MKRIFFISILLVSAILMPIIKASAEGPTPKTPVDTKSNWGGGTRSISSVPELYQNGDTIFIDSEYTLYNVNITITDNNNETIQSENITVIGGQEYPYIVDIVGGTYKITLTQGSKSLYGYFTIE
jgi:hypothetical protein